MIAEGIALVTVALRAYISYNKEKGEKRKEEWHEVLKEYRDARNQTYPNYSRDRIAKARQALRDFEKTIVKDLNTELDKVEGAQ